MPDRREFLSEWTPRRRARVFACAGNSAKAATKHAFHQQSADGFMSAVCVHMRNAMVAVGDAIACVEVDAPRERETDGGLGRNRTGVRGFAVRCMTTLPPGR